MQKKCQRGGRSGVLCFTFDFDFDARPPLFFFSAVAAGWLVCWDASWWHVANGTLRDVASCVHYAVYVDVDAAIKQRTRVLQQVAVVRKSRDT
jgi:hypothetical protein